jgi:hypothetical protein
MIVLVPIMTAQSGSIMATIFSCALLLATTKSP